MKKLKISIIIPIYNAEKYLHKTINSIIQQDYSCWELILVNDGSTDSSGNICEEYAAKDDRVRVYHQKNSGVSKARNFALDKMLGDYVTFIDSDDWIEPRYLSNFAVFPYSDCQIVYQGYYMDYVGQVAKESTTELPEKGRILHLGAIWGKAFSTSIIKNNAIRFDERLNLHEDHVFYYECLKHTRKFKFSSYIGYHYMHYGEQSLSRRLQSSKSYFLASELLTDYYQYDTTTIDAEYKRFCFQQFGLNQMVMGIFSLYFEEHSRKERLIILREKQKMVESFRQKYHPKSLYIRIFLFCYIRFSPIAQDCIFKVATILFGKQFKARLNLM